MTPTTRDEWKQAAHDALAKGHLRRALGAFRRALELDRRGDQSFELHQLISAATQVLSQRGAYYLHPSDETARSRWVEAGSPPLPTPDFTVLAAVAKSAELKRVLDTKALPGDLAGQSLHGGDEAARAAVLFLYEALLSREE
jgi:hypothetical protein